MDDFEKLPSWQRSEKLDSPAEFDKKGDIRARSVCLGEAAKELLQGRRRRLKELKLQPEEEGYYYL